MKCSNIFNIVTEIVIGTEYFDRVGSSVLFFRIGTSSPKQNSSVTLLYLRQTLKILLYRCSEVFRPLAGSVLIPSIPGAHPGFKSFIKFCKL